MKKISIGISFLLITCLLMFSCRKEVPYEEVPYTVHSIPWTFSYDEKVFCEIHNLRMRKEKIRFLYGFSDYAIYTLYGIGGKFIMSDAFPDLASKHFPHSNDSIARGCVVDAEYFDKFVCAECNNKRDEYFTKLEENLIIFFEENENYQGPRPPKGILQE